VVGDADQHPLADRTHRAHGDGEVIPDLTKAGSLSRIALVFVALLVATAAVGVRATDNRRVLLLGRLHDSSYVQGCDCSTIRIQAFALGDRHLVGNGAVLLNRAGYALAVGRTLTNGKSTLIDVQSLWTVDPIDPNPLGILNWLRDHPPVAAALLILLAVHGWACLSVVLAAFAAAVQFCVVALGLDILAVQFGIGLPDSSWALALTASVLAGWRIAENFDAMLQGNAKSAAASLMVGLLFGDVAGILGVIAGAIVPVLSKRIALVFINVAIASAALQLSDSALRTMTSAIFLVACLDRWRQSAATGVTPGTQWPASAPQVIVPGGLSVDQSGHSQVPKGPGKANDVALAQ
jgi:hypothetical protein